MPSFKVKVKFASDPTAKADINGDGKIEWTAPLPNMALKSFAALHQMIMSMRSFLAENGGTDFQMEEEAAPP